ncbi:MAG: hypothetical protein M0032_04400, partial [Actinomycetota bacterium]|nr:hypothetical protein [Actinomycetota bacterium]
MVSDVEGLASQQHVRRLLASHLDDEHTVAEDDPEGDPDEGTGQLGSEVQGTVVVTQASEAGDDG